MVIDKFYGCCSLQRGAIIWGVLCLVVDLARFIPSVLFLTSKNESSITGLLSFTLFVTMLDIITSILLILGAVQKRKDFVLLWLIYYFAEIVFTVIIFNIVYPALILFAPCLYAWVCVFAFYKSLDNEQNGGYNSAPDGNDPLTVTL